MFNIKVSQLAMVTVVALLALQNTACTVISAVDLAASTAIGVTKVAVKGTTAVVSAVIPDGDKDKDKED